MLSTLLVVGVISHLWCAAHLVGIAHHSFYSAHLPAHLKLEQAGKRFKDRYGIHALSIPGESLSAATEGTDCFKDRLSKIIEEKCLTLN